MATTASQTLTAYAQTALKSLEETTDPSALSNLTKELYVRAREYPACRELFKRDDVRLAIGEALVKNNAEGLKAVLVGMFTGVAKEGRPEQAEEYPGPDPFTTEESYASVIKLGTGDRVARLNEVTEASDLYLTQKKSAERRQFAEQLTKNFITRSKIQITEEQKSQEANRIEKALSLEWYRSQAEINNAIEQSPYRETVSGRVVQQIASDSEKTARGVRASQERIEQTLGGAATSIANEDEVVVYKPKVFLQIAADQAERSTKVPVARIIERAVTLENATVGFTGNEEGLPLTLSPLAKTPVQKFVAGIVDALPEAPREAIIAGVVGGAWEKAIDTATRYYGQQIVNEDWFQQAITHGNKGVSNKKSALQSITSGTQKVLADVAVTVFRGEMDEATRAYLENIRQHTAVPKMASAIFRKLAGETAVAPTERGQPVTEAGTVGAVLRGPAGEAVVTQTETIRQYIMTMGPVSYQQFYAAAVYSHNPGLLSYGLSLGLRYGARKLAQGAIKAGVKKAAVSTAVKVGAEAAIGAGTGGVGALVMIGADLLRGLFNKGISFFKNLIGMGGVEMTADKWLLVAAAGFALVFFLPIFPLLNLPAFNQSMIDTSLATSLGGGEDTGNEPSVPPPNFGPINGSIADCIVSQNITIEGVTTLVLSTNRVSRIQDISQKYPQLGCYSQVLQCPTQKINITAFPADSGGYGGYAPSGSPGSIIFYPTFFTYSDYYFAYLLAHEMMHEVEWLHPNIYDAFMNGTTDGSFQKGYCGPLGTYRAGVENSYETMAEAAAFYLVGNPILQQLCPSAYNFMQKLFSQCFL